MVGGTARRFSHSQNLTDGAWISAGETIFFQGAMWFEDSEDAPLNSVFDVQVGSERPTR